MPFAWEKYASVSCWLYPPCSGLGFTAGLALPVISWASFCTRLSQFTTKCFSKSGAESLTDSTGWASQTHQARTESKQVSEPPALHPCAAMSDPFPDLPSEGLSGSPELCSQVLQQDVLAPCPATTGASLAQEDQAGECVTYPLAKVQSGSGDGWHR